MKALRLVNIGDPLSYGSIDMPEVKDGSSIVKILASALNHRDVWITKGMYPGIKMPCTLGSDGVGELDGKQVIINPGMNWGVNENVQADDFEVLGMPKDGTFAEYIQIEDKYSYPKPDHLTIEEAAALPLAGVTAYRTLVTRCKVQPSDRVLVTGAGGGVALMAIQLAVALGCEVHVTSSSQEKIDKAIALGAKNGYNYKNDGWYKQAGNFDVIIDSAGGDTFHHLIKITNPGARIGFYGASLGKFQNLNPQLMFWRQVSLLGSTMGSDSDFADMLDLVTEHKIKPVVDKVFDMKDGQAAFDRMEAGKQFGKIILKP